MKRLIWFLLLLGIMTNLIIGCGGGGGGGGGGGTAPQPDVVAPVITAFTLPSAATSLTVAVSSFTATDAVGVTGYMITESAIAPTAGAAGWSASAPSVFTFSSAGSRIAYAWVKDAAGNVSASVSASIQISAIKTSTLKFTTQSSNSGNLIGGFDFSVVFPVGSSLAVDANGIPLSSSVFFTGVFAGASTASTVITYDAVLRKLTVSYASSDSYSLGEFLTVVINVPVSYVPNTSDVTSILLTAFAPNTGVELPTISAAVLSFI